MPGSLRSMTNRDTPAAPLSSPPVRTCSTKTASQGHPQHMVQGHTHDDGPLNPRTYRGREVVRHETDGEKGETQHHHVTTTTKSDDIVRAQCNTHALIHGHTRP